MKRENNASTGVSSVWNYDSLGNIESVITYDYTTGDLGNLETGIDYQYSNDGKTGWNRLLTKLVYKTYTYDADGNRTATINDTKTISYDAIGNPTSYMGDTLTWFGRQLKTYKTGSTTVSYKYGADGARGTKTVTDSSGTTKSEYIYANGLLAYEKRGTKEFYYSYDDNNFLSCVRYYDGNGNNYAYYALTNMQGDVLAFYGGDGKVRITYEYDAWGNTISVKNADGVEITNQNSFAHLNPIRYRGYYYDTETGLYYLNSRYYDPEIGRFINADTASVVKNSPMVITDKNLFAYCDNNPVTREDSDGEFWETALDVISLGASIVEVSVNPADPWAWAGLVGDAVDLIPFVTGAGELTRSVKVIAKAVDKADDVIDVAKSVKRSVNNASGAYEILFKSGKNYVGKGDFGRAITSAIEHAKPNKLNDNLGDVVTSIRWRQAKNNHMAFIEEFALQTQRGVNNSFTYNLIWSPGKKYYFNKGW